MRQVFDISVPWIADIPTVEKPCLLCGGRNLTQLSTFLLNGHRFFVARCAVDGMMWLDPQPTAAFYRQLYGEHYHQTGEEDPLLEQATLDVISDEVGRRAVAVQRLDEIEEFAAKGRLLEVGFGAGYTLLEAARRGWDVLGLELAPERVEALRASGLQAMCADLLESQLRLGTFDVIAMYSMIEHTLDPAAYLAAAHFLLAPGGLLALRLPDTDDAGPPASLIAHTYHFNQETIGILLERCGFKPLRYGAFKVWRPKRYPGELRSMNVVSRKKAG